MNNIIEYLLCGGTAAAVIKLIEVVTVKIIDIRNAKKKRSYEEQEKKDEEQDVTLKDQASQNEAIVHCLKELLQDAIIHGCDVAIAAGSTTMKERSRLVRMHDVYHNYAHGNGDIDDRMEVMRNLTVIPE